MTTFTGSIPTIASGDTTTVPTNLATYRDALKALSEAWTSYGSGASWTAVSSNPAIGNGTWAAAYLQVGKLVMVRISITMGSSTTYGSGQWRVALPVAPKSGIRWSFQAEALDANVNQYTCRGVYDGGGTYASIFRVGGGAAADTSVTGTAPFTWGTGDVLTVQGRYETA